MAFTSLSNFSSQTANYTLLASDDVVQFNCASASLTATLPSASLVPVGKRYEIRRAADATPANTLTVNTTSSQTVDGRSSGSIKLSPSDYAVVVSDGSNWQVIALAESVNARYYGSSTSIPNGTSTQVVWPTRYQDSHNGMNTTNGVYTFPTNGTYRLTTTAQTGNTSGVLGVSIYDPQLATTVSVGQIPASGSGIVVISGSITVKALAGQTTYVTVFQNSGAAGAMNANNYFSIEKVGN